MCRECSRSASRRAYYEMTPSDRFLAHRMRYLPRQIAETEHKLIMLRNEAKRLGMTELLPPSTTQPEGKNHG